MARLQIQYGSQGSDVKELQKILNQNGYSLSEDGIFGSNTKSAVENWQKKNGLDVDGIVGVNTWDSLIKKVSNNDSLLKKISENKIKGNNTNTNEGFKYDDFQYDEYNESDIVNGAENALNTHLAQKPGEYQSQWQNQLNDVVDKILNREKFSYDLNGDALYQQYKDKYIKQGKMAMGDAIGQASAMTGGYGNSYAQSVGQQAYQAQLDNLNDIVPELYQMAYDKYNQEGQDLYNQFSMLGSQEDRDYGRYRDSVGDWQSDRNYLASRYDSERDFDYGKYADDRKFAYGQYSDDRTLAYGQYRDNIADEQWQKNFDAAMEEFNYQKERDKIADEQWQKQYDAIYGNNTTGGSSGGSSGGGSSSGGYSGSGSGNGNNTSSNTNNNTSNKATSIPDNIRAKAETFEDNESLAAWAYALQDSGAIADGQAAQLISEFYDHNEKNTFDDEGNITGVSYKDMVGSTSGWTVVSKGGGNFVGIDANAKVKTPNGQTMTLAQLKEKLVKEGMTKSEATNAIKKLQQNLGISSNWFFGL